MWRLHGIGKKNLEFDLLHIEPGESESGNPKLVVSEVKWRRVPAREKKQLLSRMAETWQRSTLHKRYPNVEFEVIDAGILK